MGRSLSRYRMTNGAQAPMSEELLTQRIIRVTAWGVVHLFLMRNIYGLTYFSFIITESGYYWERSKGGGGGAGFWISLFCIVLLDIVCFVSEFYSFKLLLDSTSLCTWMAPLYAHWTFEHWMWNLERPNKISTAWFHRQPFKGAITIQSKVPSMADYFFPGVLWLEGEQG